MNELVENDDDGVNDDISIRVGRRRLTRRIG